MLKNLTKLITKPLILTLFLFLFASCGRDNSIPKKFKEGLISFRVEPSRITKFIKDTSSNNKLEYGELWTNFNQINISQKQDTILVDVNTELLENHKYDGGYEFSNDTLILYAKIMNSTEPTDSIHSTLKYKILQKGRKYKTVKFKEIQ
jgi:hypothetical protein